VHLTVARSAAKLMMISLHVSAERFQYDVDSPRVLLLSLEESAATLKFGFDKWLYDKRALLRCKPQRQATTASAQRTASRAGSQRRSALLQAMPAGVHCKHTTINKHC
jgi:hypothetical protein